MSKIDLTQYGISGTPKIYHNPSWDELFIDETKPGLTGYEKGSGYRARRCERYDGYLYRPFAQG